MKISTLISSVAICALVVTLGANKSSAFGTTDAQPAGLAGLGARAELARSFSAADDSKLAESDAKSTNDSDQERKKSKSKSFSGNVSWYGPGFNGKKTASGKPFDMNKLTCAHRFLPFGTKILVENPKTGQSVIVEVTDRGPYAGHRVMDLTREAARRLGTLLGGVSFVDCTVLAR